MTEAVLFTPTQDSPSNGGMSGPLSYGHAWFERVKSELDDRAIPYKYIRGDTVNRNTLERIIREEDPNLVIGFSHGFSNMALGDYSQEKDKYPVLVSIPGKAESNPNYSTSIGNVKILEDRTVYFLSCNTAKELLPQSNTKAASGYDDEFIWIVDPSTSPENDERAEPFGVAGTEFAVALAEGKTVQEAKQQTIGKYNELIEKHEQRASLYDQEIKKWLVWNRDHFKQFGQSDVQPIEEREPVRQAIVPSEAVYAGIGLTLIGLGYREYKRRKSSG